MATPPTWPVNFPFEVKSSFDAKGVPNTTNLTIGEKGVIRATHGQSNCFIRMPKDAAGNPGKCGWVPEQCLHIGNIRPVTDEPVIEIADPQPSALSDKLVFDRNNLLTGTVSGLLSMYYEHREDLPTYPDFIEKVFTERQTIKDLTGVIVRGVGRESPEMYDLLCGTNDRDDFDIWDLLEVGANVENSQQSGIYMIIYWDFKDDPSRVHIYIGSTTVTFQARNTGHVGSQNDPNNKSRHYKIARQAGKRRIIALCRIKNLSSGHEVRLAEQVFINLFQSASPEVLSFEPHGWSGDEGLDEETDGMTRVARYIIHKETASLLAKFSLAVFAESSWRGGVYKYGQAFDVMGGTNFSSPLTEVPHLRHTWIKTVAENYINFRRTGRQVVVQENEGGRRSKVVFTLKDRGKDVKADKARNFRFTIPMDDPGPPEGALLDVVFEIRKDGQYHFAPLGRPPRVGNFKDWDKGLYLGMRIEWDDKTDGLRKYRHVQMGRPHLTVHGAPPGGVQAYNIPLALYYYFSQEQRQFDDSQKWMYDLGIAKVKEVYLNHVRHSIRARDIKKKASPALGPEEKTLRIIGEELMDRGASSFVLLNAHQYPDFPSNRARDGNRTSCDACRVRQNQACVKVHGETRCVHCMSLGRPCTFMLTADLKNDRNLQLALDYSPPYSNAVFNVKKPKLYKF